MLQRRKHVFLYFYSSLSPQVIKRAYYCLSFEVITPEFEKMKEKQIDNAENFIK